MAIEYLGLNIDLQGRLLERKMYYLWDNSYAYLVPLKLENLLSPFDYGVRKNGDAISVSSFLRDSSDKTINLAFDVIADYGFIRGVDVVKSQFYYIFNKESNLHYNPILSLKYAMSGLELKGITLYVAPLQDKSKMNSYLTHTLKTFEMHSHNQIRDNIRWLVENRFCDLFMVAWDLNQKEQSIPYKIYLKIKRPVEMTELINSRVPELSSHISEPGFRFCEIAFSFVRNELDHYNLYFKPIP